MRLQKEGGMMVLNGAVYLKERVDSLLDAKVAKVTALPEGKSLTDTVTFQDLVDMGIIVLSS